MKRFRESGNIMLEFEGNGGWDENENTFPLDLS